MTQPAGGARLDHLLQRNADREQLRHGPDEAPGQWRLVVDSPERAVDIRADDVRGSPPSIIAERSRTRSSTRGRRRAGCRPRPPSAGRLCAGGARARRRACRCTNGRECAGPGGGQDRRHHLVRIGTVRLVDGHSSPVWTYTGRPVRSAACIACWRNGSPRPGTIRRIRRRSYPASSSGYRAYMLTIASALTKLGGTRWPARPACIDPMSVTLMNAKARSQPACDVVARHGGAPCTGASHVHGGGHAGVDPDVVGWSPKSVAPLETMDMEVNESWAHEPPRGVDHRGVPDIEVGTDATIRSPRITTRRLRRPTSIGAAAADHDIERLCRRVDTVALVRSGSVTWCLSDRPSRSLPGPPPPRSTGPGRQSTSTLSAGSGPR